MILSFRFEREKPFILRIRENGTCTTLSLEVPCDTLRFEREKRNLNPYLLESHSDSGSSNDIQTIFYQNKKNIESMNVSEMSKRL